MLRYALSLMFRFAKNGYERMSEKILVILDLDETLIHATDKPHDDTWDFQVFHYKVYKRPYLQEFLLGLKEHFDVAVWSSASDDYVDLIVKEIFPEDYTLKFVWGRSRCTYRPNYTSWTSSVITILSHITIM